MTSVVAILNREGVALAADSAVTRGKRDGSSREFEKVTKNGNKMIRLNSAGRVSVMITGNANFLGIPWDVMARRYRDLRGGLVFPSVEEIVSDFFGYVSSEEKFWNERTWRHHILNAAGMLFSRTLNDVTDVDERDSDNHLKHPEEFLGQFSAILGGYEAEWLKDGVCPHFEGYTADMFREVADEAVDMVLDQHDDGQDNLVRPLSSLFPRDILESLRAPFVHALMTYLTTRRDGKEDFSQLIFSGYGERQDYPSLVAATVFEGFDGRVNYHIRPEDIVSVSEDRPVAICPFAQDDVMRALLQGAHEDWCRTAFLKLEAMFNPFQSSIFSDPDGCPDGSIDPDILHMLLEVRTDDLLGQMRSGAARIFSRNFGEWEKSLEKSDLTAMARLAESLIELTGFHRVLTFAQEGVGGLVDLAVIPREGSFTWLNRKSWYHQKLNCSNVTSLICNSN